jgi:hypothetical protein
MSCDCEPPCDDCELQLVGPRAIARVMLAYRWHRVRARLRHPFRRRQGQTVKVFSTERGSVFYLDSR